ncbi:uncharacterized protein LOC141703480 [Apium graveolens]|uniref:C3HC-type domain-containing protein n=1 Tax=Apium graveolens TaxID=4045 RepID=A0A6L5BCI4_APIGR|nr:hypothetical protein AG4045_003890 [Apium graveolens]
MPPPAISSSSPAASSAGASIPVNAASTDWLGHGQGSKADSVSHIGSEPVQASLSTTAGGSAIGYSQPPCRPWERNDLLRRLSTFKLSTWSAKPEAASNLACARRGWFNGDVDKIECESCFASLNFFPAASGKSIEDESSGEEFALLLDGGHKTNCPWKGNICAESLVQFPATSPSELIGGYKDRCDGLLQFPSLPIIATSAIEQMRISGGLQIDHFLVHIQAFTVEESAFKDEVMPLKENMREEFVCNYARAQKLISLCGWEPRWLPDVQDFEEHSAQSAKNGHSLGPTKDCFHLHGRKPNKTALSASTKIGSSKLKVMGLKSKCESRSPLLDCSLCGATVRVLDFLTVARPAPIVPSIAAIPETSKKMELTHGVSAASGISGWAATNGMEKEQNEDHGDAAITDQGKLLSSAVVGLKMGDLLSSAEVKTEISEQHHSVTLGRDLIIRQPSNSEVADHAQSYESRGPTTHSCHKRNLDEGGSTVDKPHLMMWQADSIADTVINHDSDKVKVDDQFSGGPSKRARDSYAFETPRPLYKRDSPGDGPIQLVAFETSRDCSREDPSFSRNDQCVGLPSTTRASSVIAMDTHYHTADNDSMESVDNHPGDMDDVHFPSTPLFRNPEVTETLELNYSNQQQQCVSPPLVRYDGEIGISSINEGAEVLNTDTINAGARDGPSLVSSGSLGIRASVDGDMKPVAVVTEDQGRTGECTTDPGLMGDFVPQEMVLEYPQGGTQDLVSHSVERTDSGVNIIGSAKAESVESGEKTNDMYILPNENSNHPSFSCNANIYSACEASKEEVTQIVKPSPTDECGYPRPEYIAANARGPPNCESNYEEAVEFDPIKHHSYFCPWVNGNVAGAGFDRSSGSSGVSAMVLCGWKLTLDALEEFQSLGHVPNQIRESESAASLYKDDHLTNGPKLVAHNSFGRSNERN